MLAEQVVGDRERRQIGGVAQRAEADRRGLRPGVDRAQLLAARGVDRAVERRMARDAALEAPAVRDAVEDLADQPDLDQPGDRPRRRAGRRSSGSVMMPKLRPTVPCRRTTWPISTVLATSGSSSAQITAPATDITRPSSAPSAAGAAAPPAARRARRSPRGGAAPGSPATGPPPCSRRRRAWRRRRSRHLVALRRARGRFGEAPDLVDPAIQPRPAEEAPCLVQRTLPHHPLATRCRRSKSGI